MEHTVVRTAVPRGVDPDDLVAGGPSALEAQTCGGVRTMCAHICVGAWYIIS